MSVLMPELVEMCNSGNSATVISKIVYFCWVALNMKVENHLGYKIPLNLQVTSWKICVSVFERAGVDYMKHNLPFRFLFEILEGLLSGKYKVQSTPVISKSKGPSKILRDIRSSTYEICRTEEKINRTTTFHKWVYNLTPEVRNILKILWKRGEIAPKEQFLLFSTIFCYLLLDFHV